MTETRFEVVALALEPRERIERFARYYLTQGASRVRIFNDGEQPLDFTDPRIECTHCSPTFWNNLCEERPFSVEERQRAVYDHAYSTTQTEWLLVVDIDEYVMGDIRLADFFSGVRPDISCVRFPTAEAVHDAGSAADVEFGAPYFRIAVPRYLSPILAHLLYGGLAPAFSRGLLGHSRGKQALRTGDPDVRIGIHDSAARGIALGTFRETEAAGLYLAHYDAISFAHWAAKCTGRIVRADALEMGDKRERQLRLFAGCKTESEQLRLFDRLYGLSAWQRRVLRALGLLRSRRTTLVQDTKTELSSATA